MLAAPRHMHPAGSVDELIADPVGRYLLGPTYLYFCAARELYGLVLWGCPSEDDLRIVMRAHRAELRPPAASHACLFDARRLEAVEPRSFELFAHYYQRERSIFRQYVARHAVVRPLGLPGTVVAGFVTLYAPPYPVEVFADSAAALAWLGVGDPAALLAELDAIIADGNEPFVGAMRELLVARLPDVGMEDVARALAVSVRSLQRRLRAAGTTFQAELHRARVRQAQRLLRDSDANITHVAFEVGCSSPQHLSVLFRKVLGVTPSEWRNRIRAG